MSLHDTSKFSYPDLQSSGYYPAARKGIKYDAQGDTEHQLETLPRTDYMGDVSLWYSSLATIHTNTVRDVRLLEG